MSISQGMLIGLVYYLGSSFWLNGYLTITRPFVAATLVGVILGEPTQGAIIGAYIQMIYMGWMSVGGSQSGDASLAGILATAIAIEAGLDTKVALIMAVPLGLLGSIVWIGRNTMNVFILHLADKVAIEGQWRKLFIINTFFPQIILLLITFVPVTIAAYFGVNAVSGLFAYIGGNVLEILENIGGVLPAVGIALNLKIIMKKSMIPYFFFGFFLNAYFGLSLIGIAAIFIGVAALYLFNSDVENGLLRGGNSDNKGKGFVASIITKKDLAWACLKWYLFAWQCINYERFISLGIASSINHILAKLYKDKDELAEALSRHLEFFNTEPYMGAVIMGVVIAMEEERSLKGDEEVSGEIITAVKTGLMGPIAGIGDTLNQAILMPLFLAITVSLTLDSNLGVIGTIAFVIISSGVMAMEAWFFTKYGYAFGKSAIHKMLKGGLMDKVVTASGIVGCAVMGGLASSYVSLSTKLSLGSGESVINLQTDLFDAIIPKLLPLGVVLLCYSLFKKNLSPVKVMLIVMVSVGLLSVIGIF